MAMQCECNGNEVLSKFQVSKLNKFNKVGKEEPDSLKKSLTTSKMSSRVPQKTSLF